MVPDLLMVHIANVGNPMPKKLKHYLDPIGAHVRRLKIGELGNFQFTEKLTKSGYRGSHSHADGAPRSFAESAPFS